MISVPIEVTRPDSALAPSLFKKPEQAQDFVCVICGDVANPQDAVEHVSCGHVFCKECLEKWLHNDRSCPYCKANVDNSRSLQKDNKIVFRYMNVLEIKCPTTLTGGVCGWSGIWSELAIHLQTCVDSIIICSNGCEFKAPRKAMPKHEAEECAKRPTKCKYCGASFLFKELEAHITTCLENDDIDHPCSYAHAGCTYKGRRTERILHEASEDKLHLEMAMNHIKAIRQRLDKFEKIEEEKIFKEKRRTQPCKVSTHEHVLMFNPRDNGWACDGRREVGGCKSKITGFHQTKGIERYRCEGCDYDLCNKCLEAYILEPK